MKTSKLFESEQYGDFPIWTGEHNGTIIELFERDETEAEEIYASVEGGDVLTAAINLASFLEDMPVDGGQFGAHIDPEDQDSVVVTVNDSPYTSYVIETDENDGSQYVVADLQLEDEEIDYLIANGTLPPFTDEDLDVALAAVADDDDFWEE